MNQNVYYTEEHELNIRRLFWKLLLHWKQILLVAIVFSLLGYGYAKYNQVAQNKLEFQNTLEEIEESEEEKGVDYEAVEDNTSKTINRYETALSRELNYMDNSLLMQMNPYHMITAQQDFELHMEGDVNINELTMIARQLENCAISSEIVAQIAEKYDSEPQYIRELISIGERTSYFDLGGVQINPGSSTTKEGLVPEENPYEKYYFYISVKSNDRQLSEDIVQMISGYVQKKSQGINSNEFELTPLPVYVIENTDISTINAQNDSRVRAYDYSDRLVKLKTISDNLEKAKEDDYAEITGNKHFSGKKYAILGFVGGAILMVLILILKSLLSSTFQTEEDFRSWFMVNNLGVAPVFEVNKKPNGLTKVIMEKLEGPSIKTSWDAFYEMAGTNIANVSLDRNKVLLTGSIEHIEMQQFAEKLTPILKDKCNDTEFVFAGDLLANPETRSNLKAADGVVLVEKRNHSKTDDVREEIEVVMSLNIKILGVILL